MNVLPSGTKSACRSFYGVFDMSGNVAEWVSDETADNTQRYILGGDFRATKNEASCKGKSTFTASISHDGLGFRCCLIPQEQTL